MFLKSHTCSQVSHLFTNLTLVHKSHTCSKVSHLFTSLSLVHKSHTCSQVSHLFTSLTLVHKSHTCSQVSHLFTSLTQDIDRFENFMSVKVFRRNATHCISPIAIVVYVCVCVCLCVCVCVCMPRLWTPGKRLEIQTSLFYKLREMTPDITFKSFTQIGIQIPIWRTN